MDQLFITLQDNLKGYEKGLKGYEKLLVIPRA